MTNRKSFLRTRFINMNLFLSQSLTNFDGIEFTCKAFAGRIYYKLQTSFLVKCTFNRYILNNHVRCLVILIFSFILFLFIYLCFSRQSVFVFIIASRHFILSVFLPFYPRPKVSGDTAIQLASVRKSIRRHILVLSITPKLLSFFNNNWLGFRSR